METGDSLGDPVLPFDVVGAEVLVPNVSVGEAVPTYVSVGEAVPTIAVGTSVPWPTGLAAGPAD